MHINEIAGTENEYVIPIEARKAELNERYREKLTERNSFLSDHEITQEEQKARQEILDRKPQTVKVFCMAGINRSGLVARVLNNYGYEADNSGVGGATPFGENDLKKDYDAIIFASAAEKAVFDERIEQLGLKDRISHVPLRVLNFHETGVFYLPTEEKDPKIAELENRIKKDLDRLGFVNKLP